MIKDKSHKQLIAVMGVLFFINLALIVYTLCK